MRECMWALLLRSDPPRRTHTQNEPLPPCVSSYDAAAAFLDLLACVSKAASEPPTHEQRFECGIGPRMRARVSLYVLFP
eukprot:9502301-Pyramimonas_sp.AAC.1